MKKASGENGTGPAAAGTTGMSAAVPASIADSLGMPLMSSVCPVSTRK